jgi:hypothetical protein
MDDLYPPAGQVGVGQDMALTTFGVTSASSLILGTSDFRADLCSVRCACQRPHQRMPEGRTIVTFAEAGRQSCRSAQAGDPDVARGAGLFCSAP